MAMYPIATGFASHCEMICTEFGITSLKCLTSPEVPINAPHLVVIWGFAKCRNISPAPVFRQWCELEEMPSKKYAKPVIALIKGRCTHLAVMLNC